MPGSQPSIIILAPVFPPLSEETTRGKHSTHGQPLQQGWSEPQTTPAAEPIKATQPFHALDTHEVWINESGPSRLPENPRAYVLIGMDAEYALPCGRVAIVPLPDGRNNRAERAHQCQFFGTLDTVALGLVSVVDAGIGTLIDVREADLMTLSTLQRLLASYHFRKAITERRIHTILEQIASETLDCSPCQWPKFS